ncbi:MAG: hypothetical protein LBV23_01170 [Deltaproteobacteria bacterium]|nr:hypothetical protein [Deltaproteobacteria bacterium]
MKVNQVASERREDQSAPWIDWRLRLKPESFLSSIPRSDALFGHLCWLIVLRQGEDGLKSFLSPFLNSTPPFIFSDAFPAGTLPLPLRPFNSLNQSLDENYLLSKRADFIEVEEFIKCAADASYKVKRFLISPELKIERERFFCSRFGSLEVAKDLSDSSFSNYSSAIVSQELELYVRVRESAEKELFNWLSELGTIGYGAGKSKGWGRFTIKSLEKIDFFSAPSGGGFINLSSYVPAAEDPIEGYYRLKIKRGRVGEGGLGLNPYKRSLVQILPGAIFREPNPGSLRGRMVKSLSAERPMLVENGYAFTCRCQFDYGEQG